MSHALEAKGNSTVPGTIPYVGVAGQRDAAAERRKAYPYRFPRDARALGGKFTVAENAQRLRRFFYWERRMMQGLGAWAKLAC